VHGVHCCLQGPAAAAADTVAGEDGASNAADGKPGKQKDKKKDKKGPAGAAALGKGCQVVRLHLEHAAAAAAGAGSASADFLAVTPEGHLADVDVLLGSDTGVEALEAVITAHEAAAVKLQEDLKVVVEANQARRKPKVRAQCVGQSKQTIRHGAVVKLLWSSFERRCCCQLCRRGPIAASSLQSSSSLIA
jgi:hypothetical protein